MWRLVWALPFVMPHVIILLVRSAWWTAGVEWTGDQSFSGFAVFMSVIVGGSIAVSVTFSDDGD